MPMPEVLTSDLVKPIVRKETHHEVDYVPHAQEYFYPGEYFYKPEPYYDIF